MSGRLYYITGQIDCQTRASCGKHCGKFSKKRNNPLIYKGLRGGEGETRTLDTGLKRPIWLPMNRYLTPVMQHLRTITNTQLLGAVAVKNCCHINRGRKMRRLFKALERCATPCKTSNAKAENAQVEHPGAAS